jgi:hypothetical protein
MCMHIHMYRNIYSYIFIFIASIGQVHKAILRKNHEEVAVKILVPGIEQRFRSDIATLRGMYMYIYIEKQKGCVSIYCICMYIYIYIYMWY